MSLKNKELIGGSFSANMILFYFKVFGLDSSESNLYVLYQITMLFSVTIIFTYTIVFGVGLNLNAMTIVSLIFYLEGELIKKNESLCDNLNIFQDLF